MSPKSERIGCLLIGLVVAVIVFLVFPLLWRSSPRLTVSSLFRPSPDKDVTADPQYNFSSFAGTVWKTKIETAIDEGKRYTGAPEVTLLPPDRFDPTHPRYIRDSTLKIIAELPPGTRLRITRLLKDQGAWGGVQVEAVLLDGTNAQKAVFLQDSLLAGNRWGRGPESNTNWDANPAMLESDGTPVAAPMK